MEKTKQYRHVRFTADTIRAVNNEIERLARKGVVGRRMILDHANEERWQHDDFEVFLADYRRHSGWATFSAALEGYAVEVRMLHACGDTEVSVKAADATMIESIFDIFESNVVASTLPTPQKAKEPITVFVGHGGFSAEWRELKDHLQDKHGYRIVAYETGARAGHTIRDVLEEMAKASSFAILVMTAEDEQKDATFRARQNVVHEAGLFQGRLGFPRAVMLLEKGVELFTNVQGIQYIEFTKGNIKETYGEVLATLKREFGPMA